MAVVHLALCHGVRRGARCATAARETLTRPPSFVLRALLCPQGVVTLHFTPTVAHCSMATLIGLCLRVRLERVLPRRFKVDIAVAPGSHSTELAVCKQLADKERVAAALENENLRSMVEKCLAGDDDPLAG